jgi:4-amino-4-deoxy-L-arabinose transferase-like glycosyltransferase
MTETRPSARVWLVALAGAELVFLTFFFLLDLPNSGPAGSRVSRLDMLQIAAGWSDLPVPIARAVIEASRIDWIPHRVRIMLFALLILGAAVGLGQLMLVAADLVRRPITTAQTGKSGSDEQIASSEHLVLAYGLGASGLSLLTLGAGLAGWMHRGLAISALGVLGAYALFRSITSRRLTVPPSTASRTHGNAFSAESPASESVVPFWARLCLSVVIALFLSIAVLGAMLPATDFDVREYHLQVPREFFQAGRIHFLHHNVYGNMPLGSEMIHLLGMIIAGDWWWGALVGQVVLASFAPMTALGIAAIGRRAFGELAGWLAATIYLSTPWVYRISIIPYTESAVNFFLVAGTLAVMCATQHLACSQSFGLWCIAGAMAGSAAACKYPALISTVFPLAMAATTIPFLLRARRTCDPGGITDLVRPVFCFVAGVAVTFGPWAAKNYFMTGNPVYPLLYRVFGGYNWTDEKNDKWEWGHRVSLLCAMGLQKPPPGQHIHRADPQISLSLRRLVENVVDVTVQSDWQSPLVFGFAPLALCISGRRRTAGLFWCFVAFLFLQWWLLTHRLDRFWLPLLPIACILAGGGMVWDQSSQWKRIAACIMALCIFLNLSFCTTPLCGDNRYALRLESRVDPIDGTVNWMNTHLPNDANVLAVGAADLFHLDRLVTYNTVFDDCIFEQWVRDRDQAAQTLIEHGITHIYVNWMEIRRYREPGSYGYTAFVQPEVFRELVQANVLRPVQAFGEIIDTESAVRYATPGGELFAVNIDR